MILSGTLRLGHDDMKKTIKQLNNISGIITIRRYKKGTVDTVRSFLNQFDVITDEVLAQVDRILAKGFIKVALVQKNLIVSSSDHGRNLIAQRLAGTNTFTLNITHGEIGTGTTAPTNADTDLETPIKRNAKTLSSVSNNIVSIRFFFTDAELPNDTYTEFGSFIDGTITIGTGQMWNRALFTSPYVKATGEDTTVEEDFTINSA